MSETERRFQDEHGEPPEISIAVPRMSDLQTVLKEWKDVNLPIDVLLVTVKDCEFLSCYSYLQNRVYRSYCKGLGYVFFGDMGKDRAPKVKTALLRCGEGSTDPGGSLIVVKNAVTTLEPKVVFCVGYCGALNRQKSKLGDVVVSAKLTTFAHRKIMNEGIQPRGFTTPVSRDIADVIKHASIGWKAPLENPEVRDVKVHCDGEFLSGPELVDSETRLDELVKLYPKAIAIEMEGEGIFTAAFDLRMEWVVIKGISDYADGTKSASQQWRSFASVMAASVVSNLLKEASVLRDWPHYKGINSIKGSRGQTYFLGLIAFLVLLLSVGFSPQTFNLLFGNSKIQHKLKEPSPPKKVNSDSFLDALLLKSVSGESGQLKYKGRKITFSAKGREHHSERLWVFDGYAWDIESGFFMVVEDRKRSFEAMRDAVLELITNLENKGMLTND